jgi:hypothetical protein
MEWPSASTLAIIIVVVILCILIARYFFYGKATVPLPSYKSGFTVTQEGFVLPTGTSSSYGSPSGGFGSEKIDGPQNCLGQNATASTILDMFSSNNSDDFIEMKRLLNKLCCFKKDLSSAKHLVDATRKQPYITDHDVEPIAEVTARCFAKTISPRDLEISFDIWTGRGNSLLERMAASSSMSSADLTKAQSIFNLFIRDVRNDAQAECLQKEPLIAGKPGPRDPHAYSNPKEEDFGKYDGFY